jgi:hypothetical protein
MRESLFSPLLFLRPGEIFGGRVAERDLRASR